MAEQQEQTQPQEAPEEEFVLTPEIVEYENRRNDLILAAGVLVFTFFLGSFTVGNPDVWLRFKSGEWISKNFPNLAQPDPISYTANETVWINPNWLFDWSIFQLYARAGDATLVVVKALVAVIGVFFLLRIRYPGPTQWWTNLCVLTAAVAISLAIGLTPLVVTLALYGGLLWIWFQARYRERPWLLLAAIPLALIWANVEETYPLAALTLFLIAVGDSIQFVLPASLNFENRKPTTKYLGLCYMTAVLCLLAGFFTPYGISTFTFPWNWLANVLPQVGEFDRAQSGWLGLSVPTFVELLMAGQLGWSQYAWALLILLCFGSFFLNYSNLQFSRVFVAAASVALAVIYTRFSAHSSFVLASILCLNCQEFYLENLGTEIRMSRGWLLYSQLGRACTILLIFAAIMAAFTGRVQGQVGRFGYGIATDTFMIEANQWLKESGLQGRAFPFLTKEASFVAYARGEKSTFCDSRWHLFATTKSSDDQSTVLAQFRKARNALKDGKIDEWKPIFDEYGITHVIIDKNIVSPPAEAMFNSDLWAPLFVSDTAVVFGRTDAGVDKDWIVQNRIDANKLVFRTSLPTPRPTDRYVESPGIIDMIWRTRYELPPHLISGSIYSGAHRGFNQPGAQYLAIRELRNAIASNPDNPTAHFYLALAYQNLYSQEAYQFAVTQQRLIAEQQEEFKKQQQKAQENAKEAESKTEKAESSEKKPDAPADLTTVPPTAPTTMPNLAEMQTPSVMQLIPPASALLPTRHYQIMAAMHNSVTAGATSWQVHFNFYDIALRNEMFDLALEQLERAHLAADENVRVQMQMEERLAQLRQEVEQRETAYQENVDRMVAELDKVGANSDLPLQRAQWAARFQLPLLAAEQLDSLSPIGPEMDQATPFAAALYLRLGRIEDAYNALERMRIALGKQALAPGEWDWSMAQVLLMQGQYDSARRSLEHAIAELKLAIAGRTLNNAEARIRRGDLYPVIEERTESFRDVERQAAHLFTLGLLRLEMGEPHLAPEAFRESLALMPDTDIRPIIEFYWPLTTDEKLPERPEPYDPLEEIEERFEEAAPADGEKKAEPGDATAPANDAAEPEPSEPKTAPADSEKPADSPSKDEAAKKPQETPKGQPAEKKEQ